jgi:arylsulfatase A-like enzyme/Flp pilus assembly protein TadD
MGSRGRAGSGARGDAPQRSRSRRIPAVYAVVAGFAVVASVGTAARLAGRGTEHRPSLLLVTIDTLRADRVGSYGYAAASTPVLDDLARRGVRFESAHSAAPLTGPSHATILTGLYPPAHGVRENVTFLLDARRPRLAARLRSRGYRTAAFVGAYPVAGAFGFAQGFEHFDDALHPNPGVGQGAERPGNEVADAAAAWLTGPGSGAFFAWVHFYDPHAPYRPPAPYGERFADRLYDGEVAFADAQLGRLLEALGRAGHADDTFVVVLADHGEGLGDHDEQGHGILLYESTLRVPWIVAGPGVPRGRVVAAPVGTADLVPTLLALLGIDVPPDLPGRSLKPAIEGRRLPPGPLYAEALFGRFNCRWASLRGWTQEEWKLIEGARPELYHLPSDPGEVHDRAAQQPARVARMREALRAALHAMAPGGDAARPSTVSAEQEERLRSLGYAAGGGGSGAIDEPGLPDPRERVALFERLELLQGATGAALAPAVEEAGSLVDRDPGSPFAHFTLAALAYRAGRLELARQAFARCLELDPERPVIRQHYGALLRDLGRLEDSERELRIAAAQAAADDHATQVNLAETLTRRGKLDEAERIVGGILAREPRHTKARGALGRILIARGDPEGAIPNLLRAAEGRDDEACLQLAQVYLSLRRPAEAQRAAARALRDSPGHPWALSLAGHALVLEGRRAEGLALLHRALAIGPRRAEVWRSLALAFDAAGEAGAAARCRRNAARG